nr:hypothetical protein [Tanacetum cinerariifolium]
YALATRVGSGVPVFQEDEATVCYDSSMFFKKKIFGLYFFTSFSHGCPVILSAARVKKEFHRLSSELNEAVKKKDGYIDELKMSNSYDEVLESIEMTRSMKLDDMEKFSCLLLMDRET